MFFSVTSREFAMPNPDYLAVHFIYKCRACGVHFSKGSRPTLAEADAEFAQIRVGNPTSGLSLTGGHHDCKVVIKGLADLIGIGKNPRRQTHS